MRYYKVGSSLIATVGRIDGVEISEAEYLAEVEAGKAKSAEQAEWAYWLSTPYPEAVNAEIRKGYSESQEFAILRQREEKPEEYAAYFAYCEQCKAYVKDKRKEVGL